MPKPVKRAVIQRINITRQGPGGIKWLPAAEAVICNVHYIDYKGPSKENKDLVPVHFKRPSSTSIVPSSPLSPPAPKRKKSTAGAKRVTKKSKGTSLGSEENSSVHVASTDQHDEHSHMISSDTARNDFSGDDGDESCTDSTNFHTALSMDLNVEPECAPVSDDMNN